MTTADDQTEVKIRKAHYYEVRQITAFITPFVESGKLLPRTFDELDDLIDTLFVAEYNKAIVGVAALEIYSPKLAEVRSLAVDASMQGRGVGKGLVNACLKLARDKKVLEVMAITSSDAFFLSCGFDFTLPGEKKALFIQTRDVNSPDDTPY